jgi:hypothetical protein
MDNIELEHHTYNEKEEIVSEGEGCVFKAILTKELRQMFQNLGTVKHKFRYRFKCGKKNTSLLNSRKWT